MTVIGLKSHNSLESTLSAMADLKLDPINSFILVRPISFSQVESNCHKNSHLNTHAKHYHRPPNTHKPINLLRHSANSLTTSNTPHTKTSKPIHTNRQTGTHTHAHANTHPQTHTVRKAHSHPRLQPNYKFALLFLFISNISFPMYSMAKQKSFLCKKIYCNPMAAYSDVESERNFLRP